MEGDGTGALERQPQPEGVATRVLDASLDNPVSRRLIDGVLASRALERLVQRVLESELTERTVDRFMETEVMDRVITRVAESPQLRSALTAQTTGLAQDLATEMRRGANLADSVAERVARKLAGR